MPWSTSKGQADQPSADVIIPRLAYHLHERTRDPAVEAAVLRVVSVTTLKRYRAYHDALDACRTDSLGPRRMDLYFNICLAMGENPAMVLMAAMLSTSYDGMRTIIQSEMQLNIVMPMLDLQGKPMESRTSIIVSGARPDSAHVGPRLAFAAA